MQPRGSGKPNWWQWPTILSLDAAAVAVAWQWLLARTVHDPLLWPHQYVLGAAVWLAYSADRWIEGWLLSPEKMQTQRHRFYYRHRWSTFAVWLLILVSAVVTALGELTAREFQAGLIMLVPVLVYLLSHQLLHRNHPLRVPKELCIAFLLTAGVACFTLVRIPEPTRLLGVPLVLFALLCFANCALISIWEDEVDRHHGQTSFTRQYPGSRAMVHLLPWVITILALGFASFEDGPRRLATLCAAASGVLLGTVDLLHQRSGRQLARVLADGVLLTPAIAWLYLHCATP
jgi:hypothetical protein